MPRIRHLARYSKLCAGFNILYLELATVNENYIMIQDEYYRLTNTYIKCNASVINHQHSEGFPGHVALSATRGYPAVNAGLAYF